MRQAKLFFYAKMAEKGLATYERDGWGEFPTQVGSCRGLPLVRHSAWAWRFSGESSPPRRGLLLLGHNIIESAAALTSYSTPCPADGSALSRFHV